MRRGSRSIIPGRPVTGFGQRNRPAMVPREQGLLFHDVGPTGWNQRRDLKADKGNLSEHNFEGQEPE